MPKRTGFLFFVLVSFMPFVSRAAAPELVPVGYYEVPASEIFGGTRIGGLSGLVYDQATDRYHLISDARGQGLEGAPRFYSARINISDTDIESVEFTDIRHFLDAAGNEIAAGQTDFEAIRLAPEGYGVYVASERNSAGTPSIFEFGFDGSLVREIDPPAHFSPQDGTGTRDNAGFESFDFINGTDRAIAGMEAALIQDGPTSSPEVGSKSRLVEYENITKSSAQPVAQYVYANDPLSALVDLVWLENDRFIALERSYTGMRADGAKIYHASLRGASDVSDLFSIDGEALIKIDKELLFDLNSLGHVLHNVEGMTLGPEFTSGWRRLVLVSDNNFDLATPTQIFAFSIKTGSPAPNPPYWLIVLGVAAIAGIFGVVVMRGKRTA